MDTGSAALASSGMNGCGEPVLFLDWDDTTRVAMLKKGSRADRWESGTEEGGGSDWDEKTE